MTLSPDFASSFTAADVRTINAAAEALGVDADSLVCYTFNVSRLGEPLTVAGLIAEYRSATAKHT